MNLKDMFFISEKDWHMLIAWAGLAYQEDKNEISGLMTALPQKDGRIKLSNVEILKQENSGSSTELDAEAISEYKVKHAMKYQNKDMKYVWWHSHHTMKAFWSGTDLKEIDAWKNSSFSLALVINLKEEYVFRVSIWNANNLPIEQHFDIPLEIERKAAPKITEKMKTLYKELCEDDSYVVNNSTYQNSRRWNGVGYQTNLLNNAMNIDAYRKMHSKIESMVDDFMSEALPFKDFKMTLKELRKECNDKKYNFTVRKIKSTKNEALNHLQTAFPIDFFEFEDNAVKFRYEQANDWYYGGWGNNVY